MNTTLTNSLRISLERRWNNYQGPRRWALPMGSVRAGSVPPPQPGAGGWGWARLGQVVGLRPSGLWGAGDGPCCSCSIAGGSGGLGRSSQVWWCPLTMNTPCPIFRDPQSFAHIPWTQTISPSTFSLFQFKPKKIILEQEAGYISMLHTYILCIPFLPNS